MCVRRDTVERGKPRRRLGLEVRERVVLEEENVVLLGQSQHPMDGRRRGRHPGRILQASAGEIETRTMLHEHTLELGDVGALGGHRDGDALSAIGAQERMEIEIAGIVDDHRVVWTEQKAAGKVERLRAGIRHDNLIGIRQHSALGEAQVSANDLLAASLRMRPDRIILGELRGPEAFAFLRAINTGHPGSMTTVHADSAERAIEQIVLLALQAGTQLNREDIRHYVSRTVDVFVQLGRTAGKRQVEEVVLRK